MFTQGIPITAFEVSDDPQTVRTYREAFESVWRLTTPFRGDRPD